MPDNKHRKFHVKALRNEIDHCVTLVMEAD